MVYRHYDICSKHCPSQIMERDDWGRFKKLISGASNTPKQPENTKYEPGIYKVNDAALNIRKRPNVDSEIVGVIRDKGSYTVTEIQNTSWGRLLSGAGWINCHTKYCTYGGAAPKEEQKPTAKAISIDGVWGPELTRRLQEIFGTGVDGKISNQPTTNKKYCVGITAAEWSNHLSGGSALIKACLLYTSQGPKGENGKTTYTHIAYANSSDGKVGFSVSDSDRDYIGMYVDEVETDSTDPTKYHWSKIKGADGKQGIQGKPGSDGKTPYLHIAYATSADGKTGFSTTNAVDKTYIGVYTDYVQADSTDPTKYKWTKDVYKRQV